MNHDLGVHPAFLLIIWQVWLRSPSCSASLSNSGVYFMFFFSLVVRHSFFHLCVFNRNLRLSLDHLPQPYLLIQSCDYFYTQMIAILLGLRDTVQFQGNIE